MSEPAAILARAFLAAFQARADSSGPEAEHHRLSIPEAIAAAAVAPVLHQPVATLLASAQNDEIYAWAQECVRGTGGQQ